MESLKRYLTEQSDACKARAEALTADARCDDAVFEKIRANVFGIFLSVLNAAQQQPEPLAFFRRQLTAIPANWEAALEKARLHGDDAKAHTESVKLEVIQAIREHLEVQA